MSYRRTDDDRPAGGQALQRLLDAPQLARVVPHLAPEVLHRVIRHAGLDRCVDLVEAATVQQLAAILDLDLWGGPAGRDEDFDADRFGEWIESLVHCDPAVAAQIVERFDRSVVVTGLSRYIRVFDPGVLEPTTPSDDEPLDTGLFASDNLTAEVGGYKVQARREDTWDAIVTLLVELVADRPECFDEIMRGCRRLSNAGRETDGLDDLLEAPEQWLHDVNVDREDRRAERGFSSTADARAFLAAARQPRFPGPRGNPIAVEYLRRAGGSPADASTALAPLEPGVAGALEEFARVLTAEGLLPERPRALLRGGQARPSEPGVLEPLMEYLHAEHPDLCLTRGHELAFLANTLVAGCRLQSRSFTPREASAAVVATCSFGLLRQPAPPSVDYLVRHDLVAIFEEGWAALHREVSLFVAEGLLEMLRSVHAGDSDTLAGLHALRRSLETHLAAGTPWLARDALDVLSSLDMPAWYGLLGLLSECPVIPEIVSAIVEQRTARVDPNAFAFIATGAHIDTIHAFMARLPRLLAA
jgi:hypothetical protein